MEALFTGDELDETDEPESVQNILARYQDIKELVPEELTGEALPYFIDWLIENVHLVEITAYSDDDAYTIFETMNDRGLSLTPTDMLKGYLLANINDAREARTRNDTGRRRHALAELGKEEDADFFKAWLRSQHAETIRERKKGAEPRGLRPHRHRVPSLGARSRGALGLKKSADFVRFIERDLRFYSR